jgi:hypothetical protein
MKSLKMFFLELIIPGNRWHYREQRYAFNLVFLDEIETDVFSVVKIVNTENPLQFF